MQNQINIKKITTRSSEVTNVSQLVKNYYTLSPDPNSIAHNVIFGTSGHRGSSTQYTFNEAHVIAISQSIVEIRAQQGITGPCYVGKDTHALSEPAFISVLEVLTANYIDVIIQTNNGYTPTPVISHAIVNYNKNHYHNQSQADGIIITSSHNPPTDGGIKYNSIFGGPASIDITRKIEAKANEFLANNLQNVHRITLNKAWKSGYIHTRDFVQNYVKNLSTIIDMHAIKTSGLKLGVDPLSGSSIVYWQNIAQYYQLDLTIINEKVDNTFSFMHLDYDGCIRIDCISKLTMSGVLQSCNNFDLFFVNDPDCDRHGIITSFGLMQPSYYLAIVANYLFLNRPLWCHCRTLSIGKTYVSSIMLNRVARSLNIQLLEVPVGFKWFVQGLYNSYLGIVGEESAGASFLNFNCSPWSTDKDGLIMCLLAAEIVAITDQPLQKHYDQLNQNFGMSSYNIMQIPINYTQASIISNTLFNPVYFTELAGDPIIRITNILPLSLNHKISSMNGIKIITHNGWVACRLSGTEPVYKIYCESLLDLSHRKKIEKEIIDIIGTIINKF